MNEILTTREAAQYLKIHPDTIRDYTRRGLIKAAKFGNKLLFRTADLDAYFEQQCVQGESACYTEEKTQAIGGLISRSEVRLLSTSPINQIVTTVSEVQIFKT